MMHFLNPKTDYAFRKIFGSATSRGILISFLNAILDLQDAERIVDVTIIDPYLAPKISGMKDTYLDVRVRDVRGSSYIIEMQVLNLEGFEKRILYNACKAYVGQLGKGDPYHILAEVVAVTITDFEMFPELERVVSRFRLRADEDPQICHQDLELVFAELPKFTKSEKELKTTLDRWFYFLKTARDLTTIPQSLAVEPAIVQALELANRAACSQEELDDIEKREMWIADHRRIQLKDQQAEQTMQQAEQTMQQAEQTMQQAEQTMQQAEQTMQQAEQTMQQAEQMIQEAEQTTRNAKQAIQDAKRKAQDAEQTIQDAKRKAQDAEQTIQDAKRKAQDAEQKGHAVGLVEGMVMGEVRGMSAGKAEMLLRQLRRRFGPLEEITEARVRAAESAQLDTWSEKIFEAATLADIFIES